MPLITTGKCWRGYADRRGLASVEAAPIDATDEQLDTLDFQPTSFVCCGIADMASRPIPQDAYCLCFKNDVTDQESMNDDQDLSHLVFVVSTATAVAATRRVSSGSISVPDDDYGMINVQTMQGESIAEDHQ